VIAAPSGAGKTSLVKALATEVDALKISISHTTRPARPGDIEGRDYFFVNEDHFQQLAQEGVFLEHAKVYSHYYGTSKNWVLKQLQAGIDVVLEIDWQGARQILQQFSTAVLIFILPPSLEVLEQRLKKRRQDTPEIIAQRMAVAQNEIKHFHEFDYIVINDDFATALNDLQHIVYARRLATSIQQYKCEGLLENLLQTK
jgi:guanylate kinase